MRLIIVSNRLPVTVAKKHGRYTFHQSVGGLVSGLRAYLRSAAHDTPTEYLWVGWPGAVVEPTHQRHIAKRLRTTERCVPVFFPERTVEKFYHGFCNKTIWPLFHYFPSYMVQDNEFWRNYQEVNHRFCDAVLAILRPGDIVWVHDYQLMLLPHLLRSKRPTVPIGFFLHIPFPSFELFRLLPARIKSALLEGMVGADLVGFHTHEYTDHFLQCCLRILGHEHNFGHLLLNERRVLADTFPMGVDVAQFEAAVRTPRVEKECERLRGHLGARKAVLSVDRLDYTKGIINRLCAYEQFLEQYPDWRKQVVLVLIVVPSRIKVEQYQAMKSQIDGLIGRINGRFGTLDWSPVLYQYRTVPFDHLVALYKTCDVALVTPLRDGMNLVAKEYLASRTDQRGVLILSEMAGASSELGEAVIINPFATEEIAAALHTALTMKAVAQRERICAMQARLRQYDVVRWATDFLRKLARVRQEQGQMRTRVLNADAARDIAQQFGQAGHRVVLLDYDGTLTPLVDQPQLAKPGKRVLELLARLAAMPCTDVVLISGRNREFLDTHFRALSIGIVAEHGVWFRACGADWQLTKPLRNDWQQQVRPILEMFADRLPGAFVEIKEYSLAWHYRRADPGLASVRTKELLDELVQFTANLDLHVRQGNKVIEVRHAGITKGTVAMAHCVKPTHNFILAIGDDTTDEDLFQMLPPHAHAIRVGMVPTAARYTVPNPEAVLALLDRITRTAGH